jgi:hypothetical protein
MEAKELRIGNWITLLALDQKIEVQSISETGLGGLFTWIHHGEEYEDSLTGVGPIPLTAEILEKAGFENDNGEFQHPNNTDFDLMFCMSPNNLWCGYNFGNRKDGVPFVETTLGFVANPICNPFRYVHQLQNLYWCLVGEELEIKL